MGKIIAIEGIDGSGKSVQFRMLRDMLTREGKKVITMDFPEYESFFGKHIGRLLKGKMHTTAENVDPMSMALWFALDRKMQFEKGLPEYDYLLFNRYVLSNAAYQSSRCDNNTDLSPDEMIDWVIHMEHEELKLPYPDIYLFLNITKQQASSNVKNKGYREYVGGEASDVYENSDNRQNGAKNAYLRCAEKLGNVVVIECMEDGRMRSPEKIHCMIIDALRKNNII